MDDHDDLDERIARLQRAAYGADVPDGERQAAATELAELRSARAQRGTGVGAAGGRGPGTGAPHATAGRPPGAAAPNDDRDERSHDGDAPTEAGARGRAASAPATLVTATVIALLAGLAAGSTLDAAASRADEDRTVPAAETDAWRVFDLPAPNGDRVRYATPDVGLDLDRDSRRMLAARWDGVRLVAVRTVDGRDGCLVLVVPGGPPTGACTVEGRFPVEGLEARAERAATGSYRATWDANGRISLDPAMPPE